MKETPNEPNSEDKKSEAEVCPIISSCNYCFAFVLFS